MRLRAIALAVVCATACTSTRNTKTPAAEKSALLRDDAKALATVTAMPRYAIEQTIDDATGTFTGKATIRWTNATGAPVDAIPLVLHPNASTELGVGGTNGSIAIRDLASTEGPKATLENVRPTLVKAKLAEPLAAGRSITLVVRYEGKLRTLEGNPNDMMSQAMASLGSLTSAGAADYGLLARGDGIVTVASAYPAIAPHREGAFDTSPPSKVGDLAYNVVASFEVRTIVPRGLRVVTNLVDAAPVDEGTDRSVVVSEGAYVRDLVLVGARDFEHADVDQGKTRVRSWYRAGDAAAGKKVLAVAAAALASYEKRFGPYPYRELDIAEASIVGGAGGVEFCSMALVAGMFYRPLDLSSGSGGLGMLAGLLGGDDSPLAKMKPAKKKKHASTVDAGPPASSPADDMLDTQLEFVVAHEVAHQYFAGIVGNDAKKHASVDEPLAQYAAGLAYEDRHGAKSAEHAMDLDVKTNYAMYRMLGGADGRVIRDTSSYKSSIAYAGLLYGKAPYAYVALRKSLGDERLHGAIRAAVAKHAFGLVTTEAWIASLEEAAGGASSNVRPTFARWFEEAHGDADLHVDDSGDFVLATALPPDLVAMLKDTLAPLGLKPGAMLRMMMGNALEGGDAASGGPALDPNAALKALEGL